MPSASSRNCCDACQTRARTYGATRGSNSISTLAAGPVFTPSELAKTSSPMSLLRHEGLLLERDSFDTVDGERANVLVGRHERQQVQAALRERQPVRMDKVVTLARRSTPSDIVMVDAR